MMHKIFFFLLLMTHAMQQLCMETVTTPCNNCLFYAYVAEKNILEKWSKEKETLINEITSLNLKNALLNTELKTMKDSYFYDFRYINFTLAVVLGTSGYFLLLMLIRKDETINYLKQELKELQLLKINR